MAKIGLRNFLFGILTEQEDGTATYGVAVLCISSFLSLMFKYIGQRSKA